MTTVATNYRSESKPTFIFLYVALAIVFVMGYVDEGYYDLRWMQNIGNWIVLGVYALLMWLGQLFFYHIILKKYNGAGKLALSAILGSILGAGALIGFFYTIH